MVENLGCPKNDSIIASKASTVVENCQKMPLKLEWPQRPLMTSTGLKGLKVASVTSNGLHDLNNETFLVDFETV